MTIKVQHPQGGLYKRLGRSDVTPPAGDPDPVGVPIVGINTNESDSFNQTLAGRKAWFGGRVPIVRRYNGGFLPSTFTIGTGVAPEKRCSYSFKADDTGATVAAIAAGTYNSQITDWAESVPAGWVVPLTWYHEINDDIRKGRLTITQFRDGYEQIRTALDAATLATGTQIPLTQNFMAYRIADTPTYFDDSWVSPPSVADILSIDIYGNPGHFTTQRTGPGYGTNYPSVATRFRDSFAMIERNGFADSWAVLELNTPARDWDTGEVARKQWLIDATELCLAPPMTGSVPPKFLLYWEAPSGQNWDQSFGRLVGSSALTCANAIKPYILSSPVGG